MKPRMQFVSSTISFMITQLKQNDNLGIVMYDSDVEVLLPLTKMDPEGKVHKYVIKLAISMMNYY